MLKSLWAAPNVKGQANLKQLIGVTATSAVVGLILMAIAKMMEANSNAFGKWGPVVTAVATLIVQVLTVLNLGNPTPPEPVPTPTPTPTTPDIPPDRYVTT